MAKPLYPVLLAGTLATASAGISFERQELTSEFYSEGACTADVDGDGHTDIVSGPFWYAGPGFTERFAYTPPKKRLVIKSYSEHFFAFSHDFDADGDADILAVPMPGTPAHWFENPGTAKARGGGPWAKHPVISAVDNESPTLADLTGDGTPELVCIHGGAFGYASWDPDKPTAPWTFTPVTENRNLGRFTHGLGIGDVDGDGRADLLETNGWWRQGDDPAKRFTFHPHRFAEAGGAQMFAYDVDGDGDNDVVSSQNAHAYGLAWFEHTRGDGGKINFTRHDILTADPATSTGSLALSQMHALALADVDGDGVLDLVTGKRYFAHNGNDPGAHDPPLLVALRTVRENGTARFEPHLADPSAGVGTQLHTADVDRDGKPDLVVGNKRGTSVVFNRSTPGAPPAPVATTPPSAFKTHVRPTAKRTAAEQLASFTLPPGFEIELVAAEPDIAKPLNLAFGPRGRLWLTDTVEYPYPAPGDRTPRDSVKVLEDTDGDGTYDKTTTFADGLNIPIGLLPYRDGAIVFTIPDIVYLEDTDGDGRADKRTKLVGPFDTTRDTHGMVNAFTRGPDGWIYACHGFNNQSTVAGADGHQISMASGNTFRFRPDGSRVEQVTFGQVNPFGMAADPYGDLFTADCHTKPVTLLLPGAYYESFGKPHDGLGFAPRVMDHPHGSTAICGIAFAAATGFPAEYRDSVFGGDVMASRVHRDTVVRNGGSVRAREEPDFLLSSDPWFRPVDLVAGPDGALYVADFYNKIIGHYEVPLDHPGRDRTSGRIWKITHRDGQHTPAPDLTKLSPQESATHLASPFTTLAHNALSHLVDGHGNVAIPALREALTGQEPKARHLALAGLHQLGAALANDYTRALSDPSPVVRTHAARLVTDHRHITTALADGDPIVRRAATTAAVRHPHAALTKPLLDVVTASQNDPHLHHAARVALRDHLADDNRFHALTGAELSPAGTEAVVDIALALSSQPAAEFLLANLDSVPDDNPEVFKSLIRTVARNLDADAAPAVIDIARNAFAADTDLQREILGAVRDGLAQRGVADPVPAEKEWATGLATALFEFDDGGGLTPVAWTFVPHPGTGAADNPWGVTSRRNAADGQQNVPLWSSFPRGETKTGIYRSAPFNLPENLTFWLAGHDGYPDQPLGRKNLVRLLHADTGEVLFSTPPPRNDTAQKIVWDTGDHTIPKGVLELVDGDTETAFAWLAVGRFNHPGLNPTLIPEKTRQAAKLVERFRLHAFIPRLKERLARSAADRETARALASALASFSTSAVDQALVLCLDTSADPALAIASLTGGKGHTDSLAAAFAVAPARQSVELASTLAGDEQGGSFLINLVEDNAASARLLVQPAVKQKLDRFDRFAKPVRALTADLPPEDTRAAAAITKAVARYRKKPGDHTAGQTIFAAQCAACHKIGGKGGDLAPNLDGIGSRGLERLAEDILAPNRNVDINFRATVFVKTDGTSTLGFLRRAEGETLVVADVAGQESTLQKSEVRSQTQLPSSLMPPVFADTLTEQQLNDLLTYLLR